MLKGITHIGEVGEVEEVLFETPFNYMFPDLAVSPDCLLPEGQDTTRALLALGKAMAEDDIPDTGPEPDKTKLSSFLTYFGQFIDHDLTARTDRETATSEIFAPNGGALPIHPRDPEEVVTTLRNGRRAQLDLDSLYGDGPSLAPGKAGAGTKADCLYEKTHSGKFVLQHIKDKDGLIVDLPRPHPESVIANPRRALIADERNDENINISQLHAAMLAYHNAIVDALGDTKCEDKPATGPDAYVRARQYVRWTYQYIVVEQYLRQICIPAVVDDVLRNGPTFFGVVSGNEPLFMPLEFSVAGFRFGHSMVRPRYELRNGSLKIDEILGVSHPVRPPNGAGEILKKLTNDPDHGYQLKKEFTVDWGKFFGNNPVNSARQIDPLIAKGLADLTFEATGPSQGMPSASVVMAHLAQRNLLRGFSLSIPTGQAVAAAFETEPLKGVDLLVEGGTAINAALAANNLTERTPLWYYVLREAQLQAGGLSLGVVGSRLVAETIIGMLKADPNSYINQFAMARNITKHGINVPSKNWSKPGDKKGRATVDSFEDLLCVAGLFTGKKKGSSSKKAAHGKTSKGGNH